MQTRVAERPVVDVHRVLSRDQNAHARDPLEPRERSHPRQYLFEKDQKKTRARIFVIEMRRTENRLKLGPLQPQTPTLRAS